MLSYVLFVAVLRLHSVYAKEGSSPYVSNVSDEDLKIAIKSLHGQLDDNSDGKLDVNESQDFVSSELGHSGPEKSHNLHRNDLSITFEELWDSWLKSEVYHWTNKDIITWLEHQVELPCYSERFQQLNITGRHLPSIAANTQQFIQLGLKITNIQHRTKLQVRAMDIVLFGPPPSHPSHWKDGIVLVLLALCVVLFFSAIFQRRYAQKRIDSFLEESRVYEKELSELKIKLEQWQEAEENGEEENWEESEEGKKEGEGGGEEGGDTTEQDGVYADTSEVLPPLSEGSPITPVLISSNNSTEVPSSDTKDDQKELSLLREKVKVMETQLETQRLNRDTLRPMLVQCYRREQKYLDSKKRRVEEDVLQAQHMCEKIRRKRSTIIDAFRLANSSALEDASTQMNKSINKMQKMSDRLDEYHERWNRIEHLCGFDVCHTAADGATPTHRHRKISKNNTSPDLLAPSHHQTGEQEPTGSTPPGTKPSLIPARGTFGSYQSLSKKETAVHSISGRQSSLRLGRVSSITSSDTSTSREEMGASLTSSTSSITTVTRRKPF